MREREMRCTRFRTEACAKTRKRRKYWGERGQGSPDVSSTKSRHVTRQMQHSRPDTPCRMIQCAMGRPILVGGPVLGPPGCPKPAHQRPSCRVDKIHEGRQMWARHG